MINKQLQSTFFCVPVRSSACYLFVALLIAGAPLRAQMPDRSAPPELGEPPSLSLAPIEQLELSNGLRVMLMERHKVPLVQVNVLVMTGSTNDPDGKVGLATMLGDMLDEGAGSLNALELADAVDFLGAHIDISAGQHTIRVSLHTPLAKFADALPLLADVVMRPTFADDELERKRVSRLTTLLQWHDEPRAIASAIFGKSLFGEQHPYGRSDIGDEESIRSYSSDDLREFHETYFRPNNAVVIVVGDITAAGTVPKLEQAFGTWRPGEIPTRDWPDAEQVDRREILLVDKPGAAQSEIRIGRIGVERKTEDYYALQVMNTILGGSFTSRLNQNLRERNGYTYGARSSFSFRPKPGPFMAAAAVQTDVTDKALTEFFNELQAILEPVTDDELIRAKNFVALRFPGRFEAVSQVARNLEQLAVYDLPPEFFNEYVVRILAVTKEDVRRVARKYLDPDRVKVIVVGDREKIEPGVRALDLGPIQLLSVEDVLGEPPAIEGG